MNTQQNTDNNEKIDYNKINEICDDIKNVIKTPSDGVFEMYRLFPKNIDEINGYVVKFDGITKHDINYAKKRWNKIMLQSDNDEIKNIEQYITEYFTEHCYEIDINKSIYIKPICVSNDADDFEKNILGAKNASKILYINDIATGIQNKLIFEECPKEFKQHTYIKNNISKYINDKSHKKRLEIIQSLLFADNGYNDYTAFIDVAKIISSDDSEYVAAILYHFIWQTKRKMTGRPVHNHMMPVFTGKQNCGKSKFINDYFLKPILGLYSPATFSQIGDDRQVELVTNNYVIFFDEMIGTSKSDNNVIKNAITRENITYRPMGTNETKNAKNNATCIGCTNESLADLIRDETGARRFPIINYGDANGFNAPWKNPEFEKINWDNLWRIVNPSDDSVFEKHPRLFDSAMEKINENKFISPFQDWAMSMTDKPDHISPKT